MFRAIEGSTESVPLVFGVETVLRPTAAKTGGKWYRGVVEAAECFMTTWHRDEAKSSCENKKRITTYILFAGGAQRTHNERLTRRVMFGTMAGRENPGPGRPEKNWAQCLVDEGVSSHGMIHGKRPLGVWSRNDAMAHGG